MLAVPESTIYRRIRKFGLGKFEFTDISDKGLDAEVEKVAIEFPYCGEDFIKQILFQKGFMLQRTQPIPSMSYPLRVLPFSPPSTATASPTIAAGLG